MRAGRVSPRERERLRVAQTILKDLDGSHSFPVMHLKLCISNLHVVLTSETDCHILSLQKKKHYYSLLHKTQLILYIVLKTAQRLNERTMVHWRFMCTLQATGDDEGVDSDIDTAICHKCKGGEKPEKMLLCDTCDRGWHIYCLDPPLKAIPKGDWNCPKCVAKNNKKLQEFDPKGWLNEHTAESQNQVSSSMMCIIMKEILQSVYICLQSAYICLGPVRCAQTSASRFSRQLNCVMRFRTTAMSQTSAPMWTQRQVLIP